MISFSVSCVQKLSDKIVRISNNFFGKTFDLPLIFSDNSVIIMLRTEYYFGVHAKNKVNLEGNTMKFSKILAAAASLTMIAALAVPVSANSIPPTCPATPDGKENWYPIYETGKGTWDDYIDAASIPDGDLTVKVTFEWSDKSLAKDPRYTSFKPMFANGSVAIYNAQRAAGKTYITGVPVQTIDIVEDEKDADGNALNSPTGWVVKDSTTPAYYGFNYVTDDGADAAVDDDEGWIQFWYDDDNPVTSVEFTLTADCIADMKDTSSYWGEGQDAEDGTKWDGFNIQTGNNGIIITNVEYSADVKLHSQMTDDNTSSQAGGDTSSSTASKDSSSTTTSTAGTTKTNTNNAGGTTAAAGGSDATDTQAATGATAGLVFAGIALAGAAVVVTKRK